MNKIYLWEEQLHGIHVDYAYLCACECLSKRTKRSSSVFPKEDKTVAVTSGERLYVRR